MEKRLMTIAASVLLSTGVALAQSNISGKVTSAEDGEPVIGASVKVVGSKTNGTVTDIDGNFSINAPAGAKLEISYVGMDTQTVKAGKNLKIMLTPNQHSLDEVMVVAFGTAKKSAFTGSAAVVGSEELSKAQVSSVTNALAGAVPGVQLTSADGAPGSTSTIRIRGFSSLNAGNDALIIVDGAPYSGDLSNINPQDVESMTVLKNAASNALYGARGANGVVMITTKRAKAGNAKVTLDAKFGWNSRALQHYDVITDPAEYYEMQYRALNNKFLSDGMSATDAWKAANSAILGPTPDGGLGYNIWTVPTGESLVGINGRMNPNATLGRLVNYGGNSYWVTPDDWEDESTRVGKRQEYNVSVSAANDKSNFYASLGYLDNEGITYKSDHKRLTGRLRADYQAKKWLKVGANLTFAHFESNALSSNGSDSSTGNIWLFTTQMAPIYPLYMRNADGSKIVDSNGITMRDYGDGTYAGQNRPFMSNANPLQDNLLNTKYAQGNAASANGFMDIEFLPGLKLTVNGTYSLDETRFNYVYNGYYGQFDSTGGTVNVNHQRTYEYNLQQLLNYTFSIAKKHNATILLGHEYNDSRAYVLGASKSKMFSDFNKELDGAVIDGQNASSYQTRYNNEGFFGRAQYDYEGRYFGSASIRRDASSRFAPEHRWGTFWSVGGAWLINKEAWFKPSWVDELMFKASVGQQGNDNIGSYRYTDVYSVGNSNGDIGITFGSKGTRDITWEKNTNINTGFEFSMFKGRLSGSLEYYYRKTTDMLFSFSVAPSLGYSSYYDNVGSLYNTGVELTLNYNAIRTKNVQWDVNFNIASLRNRLTKLHPDKQTSTLYDADGKAYYGYASGSSFIAEGLSMYTWRLKDYAGVGENGESLWWKNKYEQDDKGNDVLYDKSGNVVDATYKGITHKKVVGREKTDKNSEADYYVTKETSIPKFYGGLGTTLRAYGFDLSVNCSFQIGGKGYDGTYATFMSSPTSSHGGTNFHKDLYKSWSTDNTSTNIPRFQFDELYGGAASTRFLTNASYLNIENINFGYTLPTSVAKSLSLENLRVYMACENVAYFSARKGFDPRQTYSGSTTSTTYSPMRTISVGATVTF